MTSGSSSLWMPPRPNEYTFPPSETLVQNDGFSIFTDPVASVTRCQCNDQPFTLFINATSSGALKLCCLLRISKPPQTHSLLRGGSSLKYSGSSSCCHSSMILSFMALT